MKTKAVKHASVKRIALGLVIGPGILVVAVWLLAHALGNTCQYLCEGQPVQYWREQLEGRDPGGSNAAFTVINRQVIPQLTDTMFHDTNDSSLRLLLINALNEMPGLKINYTPADGRRAYAAGAIGELGPAARSAVPDLLAALKGKDAVVHEPALLALGGIHSDPETIIPLLMGYLNDPELNDGAALALAGYGKLAKGAVPKILPLLRAPNKDSRVAASQALKKIDPEAYLRAVKAAAEGAVTNSASGRASEDRVNKSK